MMIARTLVVAVFIGIGVPMSVEAATTWHAENYGTDSAACGSAAAPCRSISQAIQNASQGDIVEVGPGRYGDLNANGTFSEPGEERAEIDYGCFCMINVTKRLTIRSSQGAGATVLDAAGAPGNLFNVVLLSADGITFGQDQMGFTVTGGASGISTGAFNGPRSNLRVQGNLVRDAFIAGMAINGPGNLVVGNVARGNGIGIAIGGTSQGITLAQANVATLNGQGFIFSYYSAGVGNVASSNDYGFQLGNNTAALVNTASGNLKAGIRVVGGTIAMKQNNMFGNGTVADVYSGLLNCGVVNDSGGPISIANNFWGAASGPGSDPADDICNVGANTTAWLLSR